MIIIIIIIISTIDATFKLRVKTVGQRLVYMMPSKNHTYLKLTI